MMKNFVFGKRINLWARVLMCTGALGATACNGEEMQWVAYEGAEGPGQGKRVVLISGDEEYRSEEALPQLAKILSVRHGFDCVTLFAQDPKKPGLIDPNVATNIPGLEALREADLMIIATRFRELPDEQMAEIEDYLMSGRPVIGLRTATHAFRFPEDSKWVHWSFDYQGEKATWRHGFGQLVLGTTWVAHHGWHKYESTRGIVVDDHEIARGIREGEIWGPSDVYGVPLPFPDDYEVVAYGEVLQGMAPDDEAVGPGPYEFTPHYGQDDPDFHKNDPMMPIAWTKPYQLPGGKQGEAFTTTMGAATDFASTGVRRLVVNAVYWCLDLPVPEAGVDVALVGEYRPSMYGFHNDAGYWRDKNLRVADFAEAE